MDRELSELSVTSMRVDFEHSGHRRVDDVLDRLTRLPDTPLAVHADVYDAIHNDLRAILSEPAPGAQDAG
jgi:hypothetical protein